MDWARVKTIMIALLLGINIFLLVTYIGQDTRYRHSEIATRSDVCEILRKQGIVVDDELIPLDSVTISPAVFIREDIDLKKAAERVFRNVAESETEEGIVYTGDEGNILFSQNSFSLVYSSEQRAENENDAEKIAGWLSERLSLSVDKSEMECGLVAGGYTVRIPQKLGGIDVFNYDVTAKISETGNAIVYGKMPGKGKFSYTENEVLPPSSLMLEFADALGSRGDKTLEITDIRLGYYAAVSASDAISLTPTMKIICGDEAFYLNAETGEIINF